LNIGKDFMTNADLLGMQDTLRQVDDRYPGSMKLAAIIDRLTAICPSAGPFDPETLYDQISVLDVKLPGSRKLAALIYLIAQIAAAPHYLAGGIATLVGGTATVVTPLALSTRPVLLTYYSQDQSQALITYDTVVDGVSFIIRSSDALDTGRVSWVILEAS
jgi:hypothetical protein